MSIMVDSVGFIGWILSGGRWSGVTERSLCDPYGVQAPLHDQLVFALLGRDGTGPITPSLLGMGTPVLASEGTRKEYPLAPTDTKLRFRATGQEVAK